MPTLTTSFETTTLSAYAGSTTRNAWTEGTPGRYMSHRDGGGPSNTVTPAPELLTPNCFRLVEEAVDVQLMDNGPFSAKVWFADIKVRALCGCWCLLWL